MPLDKGLMMSSSQVQVLGAVGEGSGVRGTGRAGQAAPHSAHLDAAAAWCLVLLLGSLCSSRLAVSTRLCLPSLFSGQQKPNSSVVTVRLAWEAFQREGGS